MAVNRHLTIDNSNIAKVGHDMTSRELHVIFKDVPEYTYVYSNVTADIYSALTNAPSVGSFFAKTIKANAKVFPFTKHLTNDIIKSFTK